MRVQWEGLAHTWQVEGCFHVASSLSRPASMLSWSATHAIALGLVCLVYVVPLVSAAKDFYDILGVKPRASERDINLRIEKKRGICTRTNTQTKQRRSWMCPKHTKFYPILSCAGSTIREERMQPYSTKRAKRMGTVSYTHLTLPTIYSV